MAASRLTDSQKQELVGRYRQGETAQALADAYGCSPNTVSRVLKASLDAEELASLRKQGRNRPAAADVASAAAVVTVAAATAPQAETAEPQAASELAIDDADDFGDDSFDDEADDTLEPDAGDLVAAAVTPADPRQVASPRPLHSGALPASVYLLVDKTVELEARPLCEFPELGQLPDDEQQRQALMLYANPRQAKRQCGRSQRVIKLPDSGVLERTSRYLVAQGITRLVLEGGALFAIPGG